MDCLRSVQACLCKRLENWITSSKQGLTEMMCCNLTPAQPKRILKLRWCLCEEAASHAVLVLMLLPICSQRRDVSILCNETRRIEMHRLLTLYNFAVNAFFLNFSHPSYAPISLSAKVIYAIEFVQERAFQTDRRNALKHVRLVFCANKSQTVARKKLHVCDEEIRWFFCQSFTGPGISLGGRGLIQNDWIDYFLANEQGFRNSSIC